MKKDNLKSGLAVLAFVLVLCVVYWKIVLVVALVALLYGLFYTGYLGHFLILVFALVVLYEIYTEGLLPIVLAGVLVVFALVWLCVKGSSLWRWLANKPPLCWDCGTDLRTVETGRGWKRGRHESQRCKSCWATYRRERSRRSCTWCGEEFFEESYRYRPLCERCRKAEQRDLCRTCGEDPLMRPERSRRNRRRRQWVEDENNRDYRGQCGYCYWKEEHDKLNARVERGEHLEPSELKSLRLARERFEDSLSRRKHKQRAEQIRREKDAESLRLIRQNITTDYRRELFSIRRKDYKRGNRLDNYFRGGFREDVISSFDGCCLHCGDTYDLTLDHFAIPKNEGGNFVLYVSENQTIKLNVVVLCRSCNAAKGEREFDAFFPSEEIVRALEYHNDLLEKILNNETTRDVIRKWYPGVHLPGEDWYSDQPRLPGF